MLNCAALSRAAYPTDAMGDARSLPRFMLNVSPRHGLHSVTGKRTGAIFPGSNGKVGAPCQIPSNCFMLLQPLLLLLLLLCPLQLSCSSPSLSSVISSTVPGPSSQRIGAKLPPFLGSKGTLTPRTGRSPPAVATPTSSPLAPPPYSRCSCCSV